MPQHLESASYSYRMETMGSAREAGLAGKLQIKLPAK